MKRYVYIGAVESSAFCLEALLNMQINIVDIMCLHEKAAKFNSDYFDLGIVASKYGKSVYYFSKIQEEVDRIREMKPDVVFVLGISQIIPKCILEIPTMGCIGIHPTLLPRNRGRHPIIWTIVNGLKKCGVTLLWLDEGVDSGDILGQKEFIIDVLDDAASIYNKVMKLSVQILSEKCPDLEKGITTRIKQDHSKANYWRKRKHKDGEIDWRMSSKRIYDLVRALTMPYVGSHCLYKGKECKIWKARIVSLEEELENLEPGKIIDVNESKITVKTGDGAIEIVQHDFSQLPEIGEYFE